MIARIAQIMIMSFSESTGSRPDTKHAIQTVLDSHHPDPWRMWKGVSEQYLLTPLPAATLALVVPLTSALDLSL